MKKYLIFMIFITISNAYAECNFPNVYEELRCYEKSLNISKNNLNNTYNMFYRKSNTATKKALVESQKAWINYRDKQCNGLIDAIASDAQGDGSGLIITACLTDMTQERNESLKSLLK